MGLSLDADQYVVAVPLGVMKTKRYENPQESRELGQHPTPNLDRRSVGLIKDF